MERLLMQSLIRWKGKTHRKPLIIHGARQVGKTWLMKEFGKQYFEDYIYISFDNNASLRNIFELDYDLNRIVSALKIEAGRGFNPARTLIIFDEIQEAPKALASLKYFCESETQYFIIAAGSLLGMALHEGTSFPVGKVEFLHLYPLNFREYLMAIGEKELVNLVCRQDYTLINAYHSKYTDLLRRYYYVGGMPEAVQTYIDTEDMGEVRKVQKQLLLYYENDFSKHAPKEQIPRIRMVWNSIPAQLAKENRKFIYGIVREGARAKDYEIAIQWLSDYGLIHKSYRVQKPGIPLISYMEQSVFKMFMLDVGLLAAKTNLSAKTLLEGNQIFTEFKGALTEQFVAQELTANGMELYYYSTENSSAEIDFIVQKNESIIPIEVKSEENLRAQSLRSYCRKYSPQYAIRSSMSAFRREEWMTNVPLYILSEYLQSDENLLAE